MRSALCRLSGVLAAFLLVLTPLVFGQQPKVFAPHRPIPQRDSKKVDWSSKSTLRSMVGGLWMIDANFKSSIYLRSVVETDPITVTPVLWLSNGNKYTLPNVTLEPAGTAIIDINAGLASQGISSWATLSGYVELDYKWPWDPFCATVRDVDVTHSLIFTYGLRSTTPLNPQAKPAPAGQQVVQGMWWKEVPGVTGFVALANVSSQPIQATLQLSDALASSLTKQTVTVSPHGMKLVDLTQLPQITNISGGISITYSGPQDALIVNGGVEDASVGYSAILPFGARPLQPAELPPYAQPAGFTGIAELGLMVGAADPMMNFPANTMFKPYSVLRNLSNSAITVTPTIWWMQAGAAQSSQLQPIQLQPQETRNLDVMSMLTSAGLANFSGSFNLIFDGNLTAGSLLPAAGSVDQSKTYVFEVTPRSIGESASKSLQYWSIGNGDDTMVTLWNPADEAQDLVFTLFFSGGHYLVPIHLEARATRTFNVSQIVETQVPDAEGNIIPASIHEGSAKITGSHAENEIILLAVDSGIYNVRKATCSQSCLNCDGYNNWEAILNPFGVAVGGQYTVTLSAAYDGGSRFNFGGTWSSNNTSVMTVGASTGTTTGVSIGSATVSGQVTNLQSAPVYAPQCNPYGSCPVAEGGGGSAPGNVFQVLQEVPTPFVRGTSGPMGIQGTGFTSVPGTVGVQFDGSGISASNAKVTDDQDITASFTVNSTAPLGSQNLTVVFTQADNSKTTSNPISVNVVATAPVPAKAAITSQPKQTYSNQTWQSCDNSQSQNKAYGYQRCVTYQIEDSGGHAIYENFTVQEAVTTVDQNITPKPNPGNSSSNAAGQFQDTLALISTGALPSNACSIVKQSITASGNSSPIRVNCLWYTSTDVSITDVTSNPGSCLKGLRITATSEVS